MPSGLLQKPPTWTHGDDEVAWTTIRDMAAVVAVVCMLVSLPFESFKTWQWTYRDPPGSVASGELPVKVKVLDYEWNAKDDFWGIVIECAKAALMLLMVSYILLYLTLPMRQDAPGLVHTDQECYTPSIVSLPSYARRSL
jgi:hypothetical protein